MLFILICCTGHAGYEYMNLNDILHYLYVNVKPFNIVRAPVMITITVEVFILCLNRGRVRGGGLSLCGIKLRS